MAEFQYKAVDAAGKIARGRLTASDRAAAVEMLRAKGCVPLTIGVATGTNNIMARLQTDIKFSQRPGHKTLVDMLGRLAFLLRAEVALESALALMAGPDIKAKSRQPTQYLAATLLQRLRTGASLSDAMSVSGDLFLPVTIAMVRAGEVSGTLSATLSRLADHLARAEAVRQSVRSALIYPIVLLVTAIASITLILVVVLPQLEPVFADSPVQLPFLTRLSFSASALLREGWWFILLFFTAMWLGLRFLLKRPEIRIRRDRLLLRLPVVGETVRQSEAGRFSRVLGTLLSGGVKLPSALVLAQPVLTNRVIAKSMVQITASIREGKSLAKDLERASIFPDIAVQMIAIGESTGQLDVMLIRLADLLDADAQQTIDRSLSLLVPLLTILFGVIVATIIASVMLAVLSINSLVGP